jgi:hypothetical protein
MAGEMQLDCASRLAAVWIAEDASEIRVGQDPSSVVAEPDPRIIET